MATNGGIKELANFIWSIADLLRGDYKQSEGMIREVLEG